MKKLSVHVNQVFIFRKIFFANKRVMMVLKR